MKFAGLVLIFAACCGAGYQVSRLLTQRYEELTLLGRIVVMLRGEVKYHHADLAEAFTTVAKRMDSEDTFRTWLEFTGEQIRLRDGRSFREIFTESVREKLEHASGLSRADLEKLCGLGDNLGFSDIATQLSMIDFYLEQLEADRAEAGKNLKEQRKLSQCLGVACGVFFVLLLL